MKIRRIVTAESKSGVVVQASDLFESTSSGLPTNIWGFDQLPALPLTAEQVLGEYQQKGLFGPKGALRVDVMSFPPETNNQAPDLGAFMAKVDFGTGHNMTPGKSGGGMHRTDSIDLVVVISGDRPQRRAQRRRNRRLRLGWAGHRRRAGLHFALPGRR
jgi:hypothetical protein